MSIGVFAEDTPETERASKATKRTFFIIEFLLKSLFKTTQSQRTERSLQIQESCVNFSVFRTLRMSELTDRQERRFDGVQARLATLIAG